MRSPLLDERSLGLASLYNLFTKPIGICNGARAFLLVIVPVISEILKNRDKGCSINVRYSQIRGNISEMVLYMFIMF